MGTCFCRQKQVSHRPAGGHDAAEKISFLPKLSRGHSIPPGERQRQCLRRCLRHPRRLCEEGEWVDSASNGDRNVYALMETAQASSATPRNGFFLNFRDGNSSMHSRRCSSSSDVGLQHPTRSWVFNLLGWSLPELSKRATFLSSAPIIPQLFQVGLLMETTQQNLKGPEFLSTCSQLKSFTYPRSLP